MVKILPNEDIVVVEAYNSTLYPPHFPLGDQLGLILSVSLFTCPGTAINSTCFSSRAIYSSFLTYQLYKTNAKQKEQ